MLLNQSEISRICLTPAVDRVSSVFSHVSICPPTTRSSIQQGVTKSSLTEADQITEPLFVPSLPQSYLWMQFPLGSCKSDEVCPGNRSELPSGCCYTSAAFPFPGYRVLHGTEKPQKCGRDFGAQEENMAPL